MKPNINIDRISLEERIKKLEDRTPAPFPGGSADFDLLLDPRIVDQCKPNGVTDIGRGYVVCVTQNNLETKHAPYAPTPPWAINLKTAIFYPKLLGGLCYPTSSWIRIHSHKIQTIKHEFQVDIELDLEPIASQIKDIFPSSHFYFQLIHDYIGGCAFFAPNSTNIVAWRETLGNVQGKCTVTLNPPPSGPQPAKGHMTLYFLSGGAGYYNQSNPLTIGQCYSYGHFRSIISILGGAVGGTGSILIGGDSTMGGTVTNYTVSNPADLPSKVKQFFPPSWSV